LPSPQELAKSDHRVKITIELDEATVLFFKKEAEAQNTKYQRMMREILNYYAKRFAA
jgi:predicted DNA binding CopG/RHH family protein